MKTYCKNADPMNPEFIEPAIWMALHGKWKRFDYGLMISEYSGFAMREIRELAEKREMQAFTPAVRKMARDIADRITKRELKLEPVRYEERVDGSSWKRRIIGIEHPFHQIVEHVAVYCLRDLFDAKIEDCQFASIKGRGPVRGTRAIAHWVLKDNQTEAYCKQRGYRFSGSTEYYVQGDIRKCYPSIQREVVMRLMQHDITKNKALVWLVDELLKMHHHGLIIGSLLSQFICNYMLSFAVREVYGYRKERRGKSIRLVSHQVWYMDDFLLTGPDRRNVRMAFNRLDAYLKRECGLELKTAHVKRWSDTPPDIMGYVVHRDGTITIRDQIYIRAKRAFSRALDKDTLSIGQARRIVSMKGYFLNSDCTVARKRLRVDKVSRSAQKLISDYETGRLIPCIPTSSNTAACLPQSPQPSGPTGARNTD